VRRLLPGVPAAVGLLALAAAAAWPTADRRSPPPTLRGLTWSEGRETTPSFTADGSAVAYSREGRVFLHHLGGDHPVELLPQANVSQLSMSLDGRYLAFSAEGQLWLAGASGDSPRPLATGEWNPRFGADGRFVTSSMPFDDPFALAADGALTVWTAEGRPAALPLKGLQPALSPDGRQVACTRLTRQVHVASLDGSRDEVVAGGGGIAAWNPVWSADGRWLYYLSEALGTIDLWRLPVEGGRVGAAAEAVTAGLSGEVLRFDLSPDGRRAVLQVETRYAEIVRVDLASGAVTPVIGGRQLITGLDVSRDGRSMVFNTRGRVERVFAADTDGRHLRELASGGRLREAVLSPDGRWVAAQWNASGRWDTWLFAMDGTARLNRTATHHSGNIDPAWWVDGTLAVRSDALYLFPPNGGTEVRMPPGPEGWAYTPELDRDGRRALWWDHRGVGQVVVPYTWEPLGPVLTDGMDDAFGEGDTVLSVTQDGRLLVRDGRGELVRVATASLGGEGRGVRPGPPGTAMVLVRHPGADLWLVELPD
jgi:Tol biopolymer transport system component